VAKKCRLSSESKNPLMVLSAKKQRIVFSGINKILNLDAGKVKFITSWTTPAALILNTN
jgi:hypothetical protein